MWGLANVWVTILYAGTPPDAAVAAVPGAAASCGETLLRQEEWPRLDGTFPR